MIGRIVEIATDGVHLSVDRGFMAVSQDHKKIGQVALDDIAALVIHGHGATWSANLTARLAERGVPQLVWLSVAYQLSFVAPITHLSLSSCLLKVIMNKDDVCRPRLTKWRAVS